MREFSYVFPAAMWLRGTYIGVALTCVTLALPAYGQWKKIATFQHMVPIVHFLSVPGPPRLGFVSAGGHRSDRSWNGFMSPGRAWKTVDGGQTWREVMLADPAAEIDDFSFKDSLVGWFAAMDSLPTGADRWGAAYQTTDGGESWHRLAATVGASPSVFYNRYSHILLLGKVWGYGGVGHAPQSMILSSDDGQSWSYIPQMQGIAGFAFSDSMHGVASGYLGGLWATTNGGRAWNSRLPDIAERWQPVGIAETPYYLAIDETHLGILWSTDYGASWQIRSSFISSPGCGCTTQNTPVTGMIGGDLRALFIQRRDGFQASYDTGYSWHAICGPFSGCDTRFYVRDNYLYAADSVGGLWLNTHALGRGVPVFYDAPMKVVANCGAIELKFPFNYSDPCIGAATLDSVSTSGSRRMSIEVGALPREVSDLDSFLVSYRGEGGRDTAYVTFHFTFQGKQRDTTVPIVASSVVSALGIAKVSDVASAFGCETVSNWIRIVARDSCSTVWQLDSVTVSGSNRFSFAGSVPRPIASLDSIEVQYGASGSQTRDTALITLHLSNAGAHFDTSITVFGERSGAVPPRLILTNAYGGDIIQIPSAEADVAGLRITDDVAAGLGLTALHCTVALNSDAISKSGPSIGTNGWTVTNETLNGTDLTIDVSRQTAVDLHAGDEIVRIPIRANVALDTVGYVVLKDYSFNADFKGCTPESITPDTVTIIVTPECGDSTLRHYMRAGVPLAIDAITPNPSRGEIRVSYRALSVGVVTYEVTDLLGRVVVAGQDLPQPLRMSGIESGVYYLRLMQDGRVATKRFLLAR